MTIKCEYEISSYCYDKAEYVCFYQYDKSSDLWTLQEYSDTCTWRVYPGAYISEYTSSIPGEEEYCINVKGVDIENETITCSVYINSYYDGEWRTVELEEGTYHLYYIDPYDPEFQLKFVGGTSLGSVLEYRCYVIFDEHGLHDVYFQKGYK